MNTPVACLWAHSVAFALARLPIPLLPHHCRLALAPRVAAQGSQHAEEMQDQPGHNQRHVAHADKHKPDDPVDNLPLVELAQARQKEAHGKAPARRQAGRRVAPVTGQQYLWQ